MRNLKVRLGIISMSTILDQLLNVSTYHRLRKDDFHWMKTDDCNLTVTWIPEDMKFELSISFFQPAWEQIGRMMAYLVYWSGTPHYVINDHYTAAGVLVACCFRDPIYLDMSEDGRL
jgi:hypothetical protein